MAAGPELHGGPTPGHALCSQASEWLQVCCLLLLLSPESGTPEGNVPGGEHFSHAPKMSSPHGNVLSSCTALLGAAKKWDKRQGAENDAQGNPPEREEELFCVSGWALEQAAQRCCWSLLHWRDSGIVWM